MDFSLAKIFGSVTQSKIRTTMGTLAYMSPEQMRGDPLDFRTDIWSLGIVFYEMMTGTLPFKGDYEQALSYAVLHKEPEKICALRPEVPPALERIVSKMLSKNPDERYTSTQEMLHESIMLLDPLNKSILTKYSSKDRTNPRQWLKPSKRSILIISVAAVLALVTLRIAALMNKRFVQQPNPTSTPVTSYDGIKDHPALSPNGNVLAFSWTGENGDNYDIYTKLIGQDDHKRMTQNPADDYGATWSSDGYQFAFIRRGPQAGIYCLNTMGELETKLLALNRATFVSPDIHVGIDWAPDGSWLAFNDYDSLTSKDAVYKLDINTLEKTRLTQPGQELIGDNNAKISPDGEWLAFERVSSNHVGDIFLLNLRNNNIKRLTRIQCDILDVAWTADSKRIIFLSNLDGAERFWSVTIKGGEPELLNIGGQGAIRLSISRLNNRLVYTMRNARADIYKADISNVESGIIQSDLVEPISSSLSDYFPVYSPDGSSIAFISNRSGYTELYICSRDGSNVERLTQLQAVTGLPKWSPNAKHIVFDTKPAGHSEIVIVEVTGSKSIRYLTTHPADDRVPTWSRDGRFIYFGSNRSGVYEIYKMSVNGSATEKITQNGGLYGFETADEKYLFFQKYGEEYGVVYQIDLTTGQESIALGDSIYQFSSVFHSEGIYYTKSDSENRQFLNLFRYLDREIERIGQFDQIYLLSDVSRNSQSIMLWRQEWVTSDIYLVENFR